MKKGLFLILCIMLAAGAAWAADTHNMGGGNMMSGGKMMNQAGMSQASQEYMKAMDDMHGDMMSGVADPDPDTAFVRGMLPHHEGAVQMARIELKYGKDPELRKLAQDIISAQEKEIAFMKEWLAKKGKTK